MWVAPKPAAEEPLRVRRRNRVYNAVGPRPQGAVRQYPSPRRPAVPLAVAFLCGIAMDRAAPSAWAAAVPMIVAALAGAAWLGRDRIAGRAAILALLSCAGFLLAHREEQAAERRIEGWLPRDGSPVELHFEGRLLGAPVPCAHERRLRIEGAPDPAPGSQGPCTIAVSVPEPQAGCAATLDALRRGDRVRVWCRLRGPRPPGNPGERDPRLAFRARGVDAVGSVKSASLVRLVESGPLTPARSLDELKVLARARLRAALGEESTATAMVGAMLLGDQEMIGQDDWLLLRDSGLVHLLSISGLHVGLVVALLVACLRRVRLGRWGELLAAVAMLSALATFVGAEPPVLRSVLTAILAIAGRAIGRESEPLNALALSAATLAALRPSYLYDPGFELTFVATAGILSLAARTAAVIPAPRALALPLGVSVAAYLATAPVTAWQFGRLSPAALLSNVAAAALCGAVLVSGATALLLAGIPLVGAVASRLAAASVEATLAVASFASSAPAAAFRVPPPHPALAAAYLLLLALAMRSRAPAPRLLSLLLCLTLLGIHSGPPPPGPRQGTDVTVVDVGQGLSVVLEGPSGGFVLVDAGGTSLGRFDQGERTVAPALARLGCRRIETLVVTHNHDDHAGGAPAILRDFEVGELWIAAGAPWDDRGRSLVAAAVARGTAVVLAARGFRATRAGIAIEVLHPPRESPAKAPNERCLVLRAGVAPARVLIAADLESPEEESLVAWGSDLAAEALLVGHHGGRGGTRAAFLAAVRPEAAVISVGLGNRFGHPDPTVVTRLRLRGIAVYRTDRDGQVRLRASQGGFEAEITRTAGRE
jgi:competence protein ComEC